MENTIELASNENNVAKPLLAPPAKRYLAKSMDWFITLIIFGVCLYFIGLLQSKNVIASIFPFLLAALYFLFADGFPNGRSLGKKMSGIAVVDLHSGKPCTFKQSMLRNMLLPILSVFDWVFILFDGNRQRVGDQVAGTIVIEA